MKLRTIILSALLAGFGFAISSVQAAPPVQGYAFSVYEAPKFTSTSIVGEVLVHFLGFNGASSVTKENPLTFVSPSQKQGDTLVLHNPLLSQFINPDSKTGYNNGYCVRTRNQSIPDTNCAAAQQGDWECAWSNYVTDVAIEKNGNIYHKTGSILVQGTSNDNCDSILVIVGGTDDFQGVQGTLIRQRVTDPAATGTFYTYTFVITNKNP